MEIIQGNSLSNQEKTLIAMGAAMGAGCRSCADKLYETAIALKIPRAEMLRAFELGLAAKQTAVQTMQEKIALLLAGEPVDAVQDFAENLASLIRLASFVAANSAPDCLKEMDRAARAGIPAEQIQLCLAAGKMVRSHASGFSDQDIMDKWTGTRSNSSDCCSGAPGTQNAGCTCS